jgi:hypothetical protein
MLSIPIIEKEKAKRNRMAGMRLRIAFALLAALPIEALNLWVCPFPI